MLLSHIQEINSYITNTMEHKNLLKAKNFIKQFNQNFRHSYIINCHINLCFLAYIRLKIKTNIEK